jgi:hypothetical protein
MSINISSSSLTPKVIIVTLPLFLLNCYVMRLFTNPSPCPLPLVREGGIEKRGASPLLDAPEKEGCKIFKRE